MTREPEVTPKGHRIPTLEQLAEVDAQLHEWAWMFETAGHEVSAQVMAEISRKFCVTFGTDAKR